MGENQHYTEHTINHELTELLALVADKEMKTEAFYSFLTRIISPILLLFAVFQGDLIVYNQSYYVKIIIFMAIALLCQYAELYIDQLDNADKQKNFSNAYKYLKTLSNALFTFLIYLVVKMINDLYRRRSIDEPWKFTNIITPVFFILLTSAARIIISERAYEPLKEIKRA